MNVRRRSADKLNMELGAAMATVEDLKNKAKELAHRNKEEPLCADGIDREYLGQCLVWREALEEVTRAVLPALWALQLPHGTVARVDRRAAGRALKEKVHVLVYPLVPLVNKVKRHKWHESTQTSESEVPFLAISKGGDLAERTFKVRWQSVAEVMDLTSHEAEESPFTIESPEELLGDSGVWWSEQAIETHTPKEYAIMIEKMRVFIERQHRATMAERADEDVKNEARNDAEEGLDNETAST